MRTEQDIKKLAKRLMEKHGLIEDGWKLKLYHNTDRALGQCVFPEKVIRLHRIGAMINDEAHLIDTIKHEIAHALVGWRTSIEEGCAGHGASWVAKAIELGARPEPCVAKTYVMPPPRPRLVRRYKNIPANIPEVDK